jgi:hypothetical protein
MKTKILIILVLGFASITLADKPPVEADTCRLYNAYYMNGSLVSDSQGVIYDGQYLKVASQDDCLTYCKKEEESWAEQVYQFDIPNFSPKVEYFCGYNSLFKNTIKAK